MISKILVALRPFKLQSPYIGRCSNIAQLSSTSSAFSHSYVSSQKPGVVRADSILQFHRLKRLDFCEKSLCSQHLKDGTRLFRDGGSLSHTGKPRRGCSHLHFKEIVGYGRGDFGLRGNMAVVIYGFPQQEPESTKEGLGLKTKL